MYDAGVMKRAAARHSGIADRLLAFPERFVDLKEVLKSRVAIPAPDWSFKSVAPALGFQRRGDGFGAFDAMHVCWR